MFTDPLTHLHAELQRLDLLLHRQILRLRAAYQLSLDEFRGLYISDQQVDDLIQQASTPASAIPFFHELTARAEAMRRANQTQCHEDWPWPHVAKNFALSEFEQDVLLLALAPEIDLKYETLFAYLNNDVTRKWPTCDLALRLFAADHFEGMNLRRALLAESTLFGSGMLQPVQPGAERPAWLADGFFLAPAVSRYVLGLPAHDPGLGAGVEHRAATVEWNDVPVSAPQRARLRQIPLLFKPADGQPAPVLVFEGRYGAGKNAAAEAVCRDLGMSLLRLDLAAARAAPERWQKMAQSLALQQRLLGAGIYLSHGEALFDKEGQLLPESRHWLRQLAPGTGPVFLAGEPGTAWREVLRGQRHCLFRFDDPDYAERRRWWEQLTRQASSNLTEPALATLANRFILTSGQIKDAVTAALDVSRLNQAASHEEVFLEAARAQSGHSLGKLAVKVAAVHSWDDLVLPPATLRQVQEVAAAIKHRHVVYSQWGFEQRLTSGRGLKVLFSGASGTGKTMAAGVMARDLGLDLYKIDLSSVVSKYIGETEKNLDRIFRAAQTSNAILFFDEADALFGKRSEVKDAHDRYANIEVSYLLQKMEEHEGAVILASNLSRNIDEAFSRRVHYVVEFPLPDEIHREKLWRGMFPAQAPCGEDVDFRFLARQFSLAGGDIQNVALDAAFLAAQDGQVIAMRQLITAMARQMIKQGQIPSATQFKQYHAWIGQRE
jgi:Winged helix domain, variant/ATPase family associated with various cellular activities (AAA)